MEAWTGKALLGWPRYKQVKYIWEIQNRERCSTDGTTKVRKGKWELGLQAVKRKSTNEVTNVRTGEAQLGPPRYEQVKLPLHDYRQWCSAHCSTLSGSPLPVSVDSHPQPPCSGQQVAVASPGPSWSVWWTPLSAELHTDHGCRHKQFTLLITMEQLQTQRTSGHQHLSYHHITLDKGRVNTHTHTDTKGNYHWPENSLSTGRINIKGNYHIHTHRP